jgi:recombination protein RecA
MFGNPETTPGGRALKFFASVRLDIRRMNQIKDPAGKVIGNRTRVKVVKNKVAPPFTECEFDIMHDEGISRTGSLIDLALEYNNLEKKASWISFEGKLLGQGRESAKQALQKDNQLSAAIQKAIVAKVSVSGGTILAENVDTAAN